MFAAKSMAVNSFEDTQRINRLFVAGAQCQFPAAKTALTQLDNLLLKHCDAFLAKLVAPVWPQKEYFLDLVVALL